MPQILPSQPTFAGQFGSGLGAALANLVENKVSQMHAQQGQQRLSSTLQKLGYSPEQGELLSSLPQKDLLSALQSLSPSQATQASQQLAQVQPDQTSSLQNVLSQLKAETPEVSGLELMKQMGTQKLGEAGLGQQKFSPLNAQQLLEQAHLQGITLTPDQQKKINAKVAAINASEDLQKQLQSFLAQQITQKPSMAQETAQALTPQPLFKKPLTESEKIAKERLEEQKKLTASKEEKAQQKEIEMQNKAFNERLDKAIPAAENIEAIAQRMKDLLETGKVANDIAGTLLDRYGVRTFLNTESQQFGAAANELADALAGQGGVASKYRIQVKQEAKPNLQQKFETQSAGVEKILYQALKTLARNEIRRDIIAAEGKQPRHLEIRVEKELQKRDKELKEASKIKKPKEERHLFGLLPVKHSATGL